MAKKKQLVPEFFQHEDIGKLFGLLKKNVATLKKKLGKFEEPYSEVSQNYKNVLIKILLPDVAKSNLKLKMTESFVEVKAEQKKKRGQGSKTLYRLIELPSNANVKKATAQFKGNKLKIAIPKRLINS